MKHVIGWATWIAMTALLTACGDVGEQQAADQPNAQPIESKREIHPPVSLANLPSNEWVKYHEITDGTWWRRGHASMVYDANRGNLLVFGSDTHNSDWDNVVHEFDVIERKWIHHGAADPPETYAVHPDGYLVAGPDGEHPWAMHTYDGVVFDAAHDTLVVFSGPNHNPQRQQLAKATVAPIWLYDLKSKRWEIFHDPENAFKSGFVASAYDPLGKKSYVCARGLWVLDLTKQSLEKIAKAPKCLHVTMDIDSHRRELFLFGAYKEPAKLRRITSGLIPDQSDEWETIEPGGDDVPPFKLATVAFDNVAGVFLMVLPETQNKDAGQGSTVKTFIYDPRSNQYRQLPKPLAIPWRMNFMLAWAKAHNAFFLITGGEKEGTIVWVLRLDRRSL